MKKTLFSMLLLSVLTYTGCTKDSADNTVDEATMASAFTTDEINSNLSVDIAMDDIAVITNDQFEAKIGSVNTPTTPVLPYTSMLPACAVSTVVDTPVTSGTTTTTTRTITITFGTDAAACVFRGHNLKGQVILNHVFSTSTTKVVAVTYNNFSINGNKVEGTASWSRVMTGTPSHPKNTFTVTDMKYNASAGIFLRNGWITKEMTSGYATRTDLTDDVNLTDAAYVTLSPAGYSLSCFTIGTLNTPLVYNTSCGLATNAMSFAGSGTLFITKGSHSAVIKYGTGACDNSARLAFDIKLDKYFTRPVQFNSGINVSVPVTTPPTTPPNATEVIAKFDAEFDGTAVPYTLNNN